MGANSFGKLFTLTTFGESHGEAIGGVIDGCPAGLTINKEEIQDQLNRRKPGQSNLVTQRKEADEVQFLSGLWQGKTTGTPIGFIIANANQKTNDYDVFEHVYRPSHADYTYDKKYGIRDYRGGGRTSARETACRVVAGALASQYLQLYNIKTIAYVSAVGNIELNRSYQELDLSLIDNFLVRCPDETIAQKMTDLIMQTRKEGDSIGGIITGIIKNVPAGLGEPIFNKLHASLGAAMLSINAVKGFEYGSGFSGTKMKGSEHNDAFYIHQGKVKTKTNFSGGIQGGISNGENIVFKVAFKTTATIIKEQNTINDKLESVKITGKGRHDACVVPRAVPIVEAMANLVIADYLLLTHGNKV
ncbi:MAG: chorismate synthase [Bacteroidia bacterium]|nr:chorismate synthase [Bacteroidia bacterium]